MFFLLGSVTENNAMDSSGKNGKKQEMSRANARKMSFDDIFGILEGTDSSLECLFKCYPYHP